MSVVSRRVLLLILASALALAACDRVREGSPAQAPSEQARSAQPSSDETIPVFKGAELTADETARRYVLTATPEEVFVFYRDHFAKQEGVVASTHPYPLTEPYHKMGVATSPERQQRLLESERPVQVDGQWLETAGFQWSRTRPDGKTAEYNLDIADDGIFDDWSAYEPRTIIDVTSKLRP